MSEEKNSRHVRKKVKTKVQLTKQGKMFFGTVAVAAAVIVISAAFISAAPENKIADGIYVGELDLSGMTEEEAKSAVSGYDFYNKDMFTVSSGGSEKEIAFDEVELAVDSDSIVGEAYGLCHSGNRISNSMRAFKYKFKKKKVPVTHKVNTEKLDAALLEFGTELYGELKDCSIEVGDSGDYISVSPGKEGCDTDVSKARNEVLQSVSRLEFDKIKVDFDKKAPEKLTVDSLEQKVNREPKNASYKVENGDVKIVGEVLGLTLDREDAEKKIKDIKEDGEPVKLKVTSFKPEVSAEKLKAKLFNTTLASYSTKYNASAVNRSKNVSLAASKVNGTVLSPGEEFSYNGIVGERTKANGFFNAPVYENGKSVDGIGGGVCQVSTTIYSAVLYADLEVVYRQNHSLPVSYVPLGQDATVVDGSIDFKFRNNTDYPIKILAGADKGNLSVSILGTKPDTEKTIKISHKTLSTIAPTTKEIPSPDLPAGTRVVASKGKSGYVIESTKTVYENGELVRTENLGKSTYKMTQEEVNVGTGPATAEAPADPNAVQVSGAAEPQTEPQPNNGSAGNHESETETGAAKTESQTDDAIEIN